MNRLARFPFLLYSYLASEMLAPFLASFLIMNSIFFLARLIPLLDVVLELEVGLADFIRLFCYLFPNMFLYSIPMAGMIGVIVGFSRLTSDSEILALKASGISLYKILPSVVLVAISIAAITGYFSTRLIAAGEIAMTELMHQLAKERIEAGIKEDTFTEAFGDVVVYVEEINKETGEWKNVWISDKRNQLTPTITMADHGYMDAKVERLNVVIVLKNGSLHRPDNRNSQIVTFDTYKLNIPLQLPSTRNKKDIMKLSSASLTMDQLQSAADKVGRDSYKGRDYLIEYHKRYVLPVGCFILCLIGLPLGLQAAPGKRAMGLPVGLMLFIGYYALFTVGKFLSEDSSLPVYASMWLPNFVFVFIALLFLYKAANEQPLVPERVKEWAGKLVDKTMSPLVALYHRVYVAVKAKRERWQQQKKTEDSTAHIKGTIHGNVRTHVFHIPACEHYNCKYCTIKFRNVDIALQSGFTACRACEFLMKSESEQQKATSPDATEPDSSNEV